jgi:hypothetical protein
MRKKVQKQTDFQLGIDASKLVSPDQRLFQALHIVPEEDALGLRENKPREKGCFVWKVYGHNLLF